MTKICSHCKILKDSKEFYKNRNRKDGIQNLCKECNKQINIEWKLNNFQKYKESNKKYCKNNSEKIKEYHKKNYERVKNKQLKKKYGITLEQKKQMYIDQKGLCNLCFNTLPEDFNKAHVDHNHKTGKVRGLLHHNCNSLLGYAEDSIKRLQQAIEYLNRFKGEINEKD